MRTKRPVLFSLLPMMFMMVISVWALVSMAIQNWGKQWLLVAITIILLIMAASLIILSINVLSKRHQAPKAP